MIDISHDWSICLMVSRTTEEVPRGMWRKRKIGGEHVIEKSNFQQFPIDAQMNDNPSEESGHMLVCGSSEFASCATIKFKHSAPTDDEEYELFGSPSSSASSEDDCR